MNRFMSTCALSGAALMLLAGPASAAHEGARYDASLNALNGETGSGSAVIQVSEDGETMDVTVTASNLKLDFVHALHIHGILEGNLDDAPDEVTVPASGCPTLDRDTGSTIPGQEDEPDGFISVVEGAADYGGVLVSLTTEGDTSPDSALAVERFPAGTEINYQRTIAIPEALKAHLAKLHVVVHATDTDDNGDHTNDNGAVSSLNPDLPFDATVPALCGTFTVASTGAVQTGAGGTATTTDTGGVLAGGALLMAGLLGLAIRGRRQTA
jgi:hypothetical protein